MSLLLKNGVPYKLKYILNLEPSRTDQLSIGSGNTSARLMGRRDIYIYLNLKLTQTCIYYNFTQEKKSQNVILSLA